MQCLFSRTSCLDAFAFAVKAATATAAALIGVFPLRISAEFGGDVFPPLALCLIVIGCCGIGLSLTVVLVVLLRGVAFVIRSLFVLACLGVAVKAIAIIMLD